MICKQNLLFLRRFYMTFSLAVWALLIGALIALLYALTRTLWIYKQDKGSEKLQRISSYVSKGAMSFLMQEYKILIPFIIIVAIILFTLNVGINRLQSLAFIIGAFASASAGFIGMKIATASNSRTTFAATKDINSALRVAFSGGSVMGMCVVGLASLGLFVLLTILQSTVGITTDAFTTYYIPIITGYSLGASTIALFARVGGGIFTKAADVGADLVGKVEVGIPEDDPRNPATIADNVGDNVGDVAGMGADLFESFVGSIIGTLILAFTAPVSNELKIKLATIPLIMVTIGIIASIIGVFFVRTKKGRSPQKALNTGTFVAAFLVLIVLLPVISWILGIPIGESSEGIMPQNIFFAAMLGLAAGIVIGLLTEHYTGFGTRPVKRIVKASETGSATNIITGISVGMMSCFLPVTTIIIAIGTSFMFAGLYGIAIAALGMLITLGIQLAVDAYGPIADNAGGLAVMAEYPPEVREITDTLDSVGNTTAAIGKGFAIGSAALTSLILFTAFKEATGITSIDITSIPVLMGLMFGAVVPYLFSSFLIGAIGKAALKMVNEVRHQFKTIVGIMEYKATPDYNRCINISTQASLKEMTLPALGAIAAPVLVGFLGGTHMLTGFIIGGTISGIILAIFMANSGGAWDNAKKMIEERKENGKGSEAHKASVVGDTVGDPFKDTAGPSLNILIKLMAVISLVIAPFL